MKSAAEIAPRTYFIRHTADLDIDDETRQQLWKQRMIAIHYPRDKRDVPRETDNDSLNPDDYTPSGRKAMRALQRLAEEGGYVCAEYFPHSECLVGRIRPNSKIELFKGKWGKLEGRVAVLKILRLIKVKELRRSDYAVIATGRPRQGTITHWPNARDAIENIVENRRCKPALLSLSTPRQETMCSEFLRLPDVKKFGLPHLVHLLLPVGGTMRDVDILGLAEDGKKIYAQVTFAGRRKEKFDALAKYLDEAKPHLIFFCSCAEPTIDGGIIVFPIQKVFDTFCETEFGSKWLKDAV